MTDIRPCDCSGHHLRFPERLESLLHEPRRPYISAPIPDVHQHEDERCSKPYLGIGGCPGLPHCRDWIIGAYEIGEYIAEATGDGARALEIAEQRRGLEQHFARMSEPV